MANFPLATSGHDLAMIYIIEALECLKSRAREQVIWGWDGSWTGGEDFGGSGAMCIGYGAVGVAGGFVLMGLRTLGLWF